MKRKILILISVAVMIVFMLPALILTAFANGSDIETEIIPFGDDEPTVQIGDGNEDGKIDAEDLIVLRKALHTDAKYTEVLDCNGDGVLDIRDLVRMKKHIASGTPLGKLESNS